MGGRPRRAPALGADRYVGDGRAARRGGAVTVTATAPISVGVIGAGRIGRLHAELLARRIPGARVGAVYDVHEPFALGVAADLDVPVAGSVEEILDADVDAVAVCSSADTHVELMMAAGGAPRRGGVSGRSQPAL